MLARRLGSVVPGLLLAAVVGVGAPARAAEPVVGIADQNAAMLSNPFWRDLALRWRLAMEPRMNNLVMLRRVPPGGRPS